MEEKIESNLPTCLDGGTIRWMNMTIGPSAWCRAWNVSSETAAESRFEHCEGAYAQSGPVNWSKKEGEIWAHVFPLNSNNTWTTLSLSLPQICFKVWLSLKSSKTGTLTELLIYL